MMKTLLACFMALVLLVGHSLAQPFFIGGYGGGVYVSELKQDGSMTTPTLLAEQANPSFFCLHPSLDILYVVTETMRDDTTHPAKVVAYRFNRSELQSGKTPALEPFSNQKVDGDIPCHITIDAKGKFLVLSNYTSGSVIVYPIAADGSIGSESANVVHHVVEGKKKSNAHCALFDPTNRWVLVADLGLDRVFVYDLDTSTGKLMPSPHPHMVLPDGSGPRHLAFHPNGKYLYVINELNMTMSSAGWDGAVGRLELIDTEGTLPPGTNGQNLSTAEVIVHPSGKFVFGSNRGHNSIVTMSIDLENGSIKRIDNASTMGKTPRNFRLSPDGQILLAENQSSDSIFSFRIDPSTGKLAPTGHSITIKAPACIRFLKE